MSQFFAWSSEWLWLFVFILPLPLIFRKFFPPAPPHTNTALKVPFYNDIAQLAKLHKKDIQKSSFKKISLAWLIWLLLVLAAMRPQLLGDPIQMQISGRNLLLAVDLSESMAESNNRLSIVKSVLGEFIERRKGDKLGLILFGDKAYLQTPLTFDRFTVKTMLEEAFIGIAGEKTAIGDAIGLAIKLLRDQPQENRVLILLTDGSNTAGKIQPLQAAKLAKKYAVSIYTIGINSLNLDEKTLQKIANMTNGQYFRAQNRAELDRIYHSLDKYEPIKEKYKIIRHKTALYPWLLATAFFLSILVALKFK